MGWNIIRGNHARQPRSSSRKKVGICIVCFEDETLKYFFGIIPEPTARSAVPGVSPGRGLLIPLGYLHPGKCEHRRTPVFLWRTIMKSEY